MNIAISTYTTHCRYFLTAVSKVYYNGMVIIHIYNNK